MHPRAAPQRPKVVADRTSSDESSEGTRLALRRAVTLLSRRALTSTELRKHLGADFGAAAVDRAVRTLEETGYLNDATVASSYVSNRRARERSASLLRRELAERGIDAETIESALAEHDDLEAATAAATRRWRALRTLEPEVAQRRLGDYLARRGFRRAAIEAAVQAVSATRDDSSS